MSIGNSPEDERPFEDDRRPRPPVDRSRPPAGPHRRRADRRRGQLRHPGAHPHRARDRSRTTSPAAAATSTPAGTSARSPAPSGSIPTRWSRSTTPSTAGVPRRPRPRPLFEAERIRPERRRPNWTAAMVAAIVAVVGFVGFTLVQRRRRRRRRDAGRRGRHARPASRPPSPRRPSPPTRSPSRPTAPSRRRRADKVTVRLSAADGQELDLRQGPQRHGCSSTDCCSKGESKTFQDNEQIDLVLGDAGRHPALRQRQEDRGRVPAGPGRAAHVHEGRPRGRLRVRRDCPARGWPRSASPGDGGVGGTK